MVPDLVAAIETVPVLAVAVSGGVDSMVLAHVVQDWTTTRLVAFHALSPAVPALATARVRAHALRQGWDLRLIDAGEMNDPRYVANPVDRCFYCKTNLYGHIRALTALPLASGTNLDDLDDYRPGLAAAKDHGVQHPFVTAGLTKADIYDLARRLGLDDVSALPPQPCLSSRIETGLGIDATALAFVERAETHLAAMLPDARHLRCRVTLAGIIVEADPLPDAPRLERLHDAMEHMCRAEDRVFLGLRPYRRGSAFLHGGRHPHE